MLVLLVHVQTIENNTDALTASKMYKYLHMHSSRNVQMFIYILFVSFIYLQYNSSLIKYNKINLTPLI